MARNFLAVQWLELRAFTAGAQVGSQVRELRFHKPHGMAKAGENKHTNGQETHEKMFNITTRKMQINTTIYHFTPIRIATIKTAKKKKKRVHKEVEKLKPYALKVGMLNSAATVENGIEILQKY